MSDERLWNKLNEISERMARVEVLMQKITDDTTDIRRAINDHEARLKELESHKDATIGAKDVLTWAVMAGIALWGVLK